MTYPDSFAARLGAVRVAFEPHPVRLAFVRPPRDPDPVVFGTWRPPGSWEYEAPLECLRCGAEWELAAGVACWLCGMFATGPKAPP